MLPVCECLVDGDPDGFMAHFFTTDDLVTVFDGTGSVEKYVVDKVDYAALYLDHLQPCEDLIDPEALEKAVLGAGAQLSCADSAGADQAVLPGTKGSLAGLGLSVQQYLRLTFDLKIKTLIGGGVVDTSTRDRCIGPNLLEETWCDGAHMRITVFTCADGCIEGACSGDALCTPGKPGCDAAPGPAVVDAGQDITADSGDTVTLDGSASQGPNGAAPILFWKQLSGPPVVLKGANSAVATFEAPPYATELEFQLSALIAGEWSLPDTVQVTIIGPEPEPEPEPEPDAQPQPDPSGDHNDVVVAEPGPEPPSTTSDATPEESDATPPIPTADAGGCTAAPGPGNPRSKRSTLWLLGLLLSSAAIRRRVRGGRWGSTSEPVSVVESSAGMGTSGLAPVAVPFPSFVPEHPSGQIAKIAATHRKRLKIIASPSPCQSCAGSRASEGPQPLRGVYRLLARRVVGRAGRCGRGKGHQVLVFG